MTEVLERIRVQRILPVLRSRDVDDAIATARACAHGTISVVELTYTTPRVEEAVRTLVADGLVVGVGTVTSREQVRTAAAAGASFVVSFTNPEGMVPTADECSVTAIPGAMTPTEVADCVRVGAQAVKLFPARVLGARYLRDLRSVLPDVCAIATGGLRATPESFGPWLDAGALAVGIGSELGSAGRDGPGVVANRVRHALAAVRDALGLEP